jgi:hypothetical protein
MPGDVHWQVVEPRGSHVDERLARLIADPGLI